MCHSKINSEFITRFYENAFDALSERLRGYQNGLQALQKRTQNTIGMVSITLSILQCC